MMHKLFETEDTRMRMLLKPLAYSILFFLLLLGPAPAGAQTRQGEEDGGASAEEADVCQLLSDEFLMAEGQDGKGSSEEGKKDVIIIREGGGYQSGEKEGEDWVPDYKEVLAYLKRTYKVPARTIRILEAEIIWLPGEQDPLNTFYVIVSTDSLGGHPVLAYIEIVGVVSVAELYEMTAGAGCLESGETASIRSGLAPALGEIQVERTTLPDMPALLSNYPNPFNPQTTLRFTLDHGGPVRLIVFDLLGRQVQQLVNETRPAGTYAVSFHGDALPSGTYLARLETTTGVVTHRLSLVR